jgi:hypothetical protein
MKHKEAWLGLFLLRAVIAAYDVSSIFQEAQKDRENEITSFLPRINGQ